MRYIYVIGLFIFILLGCGCSQPPSTGSESFNIGSLRSNDRMEVTYISSGHSNRNAKIIFKAGKVIVKNGGKLSITEDEVVILDDYLSTVLNLDELGTCTVRVRLHLKVIRSGLVTGQRDLIDTWCAEKDNAISLSAILWHFDMKEKEPSWRLGEQSITQDPI